MNLDWLMVVAVESVASPDHQFVLKIFETVRGSQIYQFDSIYVALRGSQI